MTHSGHYWMIQIFFQKTFNFFYKKLKTVEKSIFCLIFEWSRFFLKNLARSVFLEYYSLTSCQKSKKSLEWKYQNFLTDRRTNILGCGLNWSWELKRPWRPGLNFRLLNVLKLNLTHQTWLVSSSFWPLDFFEFFDFFDFFDFCSFLTSKTSKVAFFAYWRPWKRATTV